MTTMTKLKRLKNIPSSGEVIISVNLAAIANPTELWDFVVSMNLEPEIRWLRLNSGTQMHLVVVQFIHPDGQIPKERYDLITDALEDFGVDFDHIRYVRGSSYLRVAS